jgi:hypothetical protein
MKLRWAIVGMVAAALVGSAAGGGIVKCMQRHEVVVTIDQVPAPVKATLQREAEDGKITEIERESGRGKTMYEARATIGNNTYEMKVAEDGTLIMKMMKKGRKR